MSDSPRIYLVHALAISMPPIVDSFHQDWPQAQLANLLDDSLFADFGRDGQLTGAMIERFRSLGRYCAGAGADAIVFTCSAFGPAIDAVKRDQSIPVLKPNEALYDDLATRGGRIALLATFAPTLPAMLTEIDAHARLQGHRPQIETCLVEGALDALRAGRQDEHNRLIADAAVRFAEHDAVAFAQMSMASAQPLAQARLRVPVMTTPDSTIRALKAIMA